MKPSAFSFQLSALLLALVISASAQQPTNVQKGGAAGTNNITADLYFPAPRELRLSGIFSGTPAGGVLDLSNVDLSGDLAFSGAQSAASYSAADFFASTRLFVPKAADGSPSERMLWLSTTTADRLKYRGAATTFSLATTADIGVTVQAYDADLASIAGNATGGFLTRTAANTYTARTLTGPAAGIAVSNGDGVSGNPTLALANDLSALEGLASTGFAVRSASDTWVQRTIAGTSPVQVANGTGVSGNPTISVDAATTSASGIVELATTAETLAGTSTTLAPPVSAVEARVLQGDFTRGIRDALYSDGSTSLRRVEITPGTAGAVAALPISIPFEFQVLTSNPSASVIIAKFGPTANPVTSTQDNSLNLFIDTSGGLSLWEIAVGTGNSRRLDYAGFRAAYSGLWVRGMVVFATADSTTAPVIYLQGVDATASFTATAPGTPPNWMPTALDTTRFYSGGAFTAGRFIPHGPILGALTAAEVLEWTQTGRLPVWCEIATGSAVATVTNDGTAAGNFVNTGGNAGAAFDVNSTVAGKIYFLLKASGNSWFANTPALSSEPIGKRFGFTIKARLRSGSAVPIIVGSDLTSAAVTSFTPTGTETTFTGTFTNNAGVLRIGTPGSANGSSYEFDDFAMWPLGPIFKPVIQPIAVLADAGTNKIAGILTSGITPITLGDRGAFTATLTWSGTHEGKSLIGAQAIPSNAIITRIWRKATVASSGSGCTIGTTNSATRWQALDTYTTAAEIVTLANQLPAGTAANDLDIVVDPDTANYTGSITVTVEYQIVGGTP